MKRVRDRKKHYEESGVYRVKKILVHGADEFAQALNDLERNPIHVKIFVCGLPFNVELDPIREIENLQLDSVQEMKKFNGAGDTHLTPAEQYWRKLGIVANKIRKSKKLWK
jgi:hypothetical protein